MTDEKNTSHDARDTDDTLEQDSASATETPPKKEFHSYGWMLWTILFCLALLGLTIVSLSQSEQINDKLKVIPTVARDVITPRDNTDKTEQPDADPETSQQVEKPSVDDATRDDVHVSPEATTDTKSEPQAESQNETQAEQKPEIKQEAKQEPEIKPEIKQDIKPEPKVEPVFVPDEAPPQTETPIKLDQQSKVNFTPLPDQNNIAPNLDKQNDVTVAAVPVSLPIQNAPTQNTDPTTEIAHPQFKKPVIAIVIDDMGLDRRHTAQIVSLAAPITVAYMPYAEQLDQQASQAWKAGHELMVHMPMEPENLAQNNPGPNALLIKNGEDENLRRLRKNLTSFNGYMGINNHMGSAFTMSRAAVTPILKELKTRGVWFLDSKTDARSVAGKVAGEIGLPYAARDVFLDNVNSKAYVLKQLQEVERVARQKGFAIAIGHPRTGTVQALAEWLPQLAQRNLTLVPLSTIIHARFPKAPLPSYARAKDFKVTQVTVSASAQH
jgi:polysaccharide deacetylase 2 family uncharacterized protein YibQ